VLDPVSATNPANYGIASNPYNFYVDDTNYTVVAASLRPDQRSVILKLSQTFPGWAFRLLATNVADLAGNSRFAGGITGVHNRNSMDIGNPGVNPKEPGSFFSCDGSTFEVLAGGSGLEGTNDSFHFVYEPWREAAVIFQVQVSSLEVISRFTSGGLMVREDLTPGSRYFSVLATPQDVPARDGTGLGANTLQIHYRNTTNGASQTLEINPPVLLSYPNVWLELFGGSNGEFRARFSTNRFDWTLIGSVAFPEPLALQKFIGLATSSDNNNSGFVTRAVYSNYRVQHTDPPGPPKLLIEPVGTNLVLSWVELGGLPYYVLTKPDVASGLYWRAVTNQTQATPVNLDGSFWQATVTLPIALQNQFFALNFARR
jgi:hypothetical protein